MSFKILGPNHYSSDPGDTITYTATAEGVPFNANIGQHSAGAVWTVLQSATAANPTEKRSFVMPATNDRLMISYGFGPNAPADANYSVAIAGPGGIDNFNVGPGAFTSVVLPYFFDAAQPAPVVRLSAAKKKAPAKKKTTPKKKTPAKKKAR